MVGEGDDGPAEDDDWLRPRVVTCSGCGISIFQVDHSPFIDGWRIYCDRCPLSVEVSYYDKVVARLDELHPRSKDRKAFFRGIERRLKPCDCGGSFRFRATRRCHGCGAAITDDPDVDLHIYFGAKLEEELKHRDPTAAEQAAYDEWQARFIKTKDLWRQE